MAAVLIVRDPDPERRRRGMQAAEASMRRFDIEVSAAEQGVIGIVWGTFPGGPVSRSPDAFVMGDVIPGPGPERLSAAEYAERVARAGTPPAFDGFHFAATFDERGALSVAVDTLGTFAVYVASASEALVIASSPALITTYPGFDAALDPLGLAALLVVNGPVRGRTPYRGIRRLARGHALVASAGGAPREVQHYAIELHGESYDVPFEECALRLNEAFVDAAKRHIPTGQPHTMLLSGGLDSRIVVGTLARQGVPMNVITRGDASDLEYHCARAVARRLGLTQHHLRHAETFEALERMLWWDGMVCSPGLAGGNGLGEPLRHAHSYLTSGMMAESALGGITMTKPFDQTSRTASFEQYLRTTNKWGVPLAALPRLLRGDVFGDSVRTIVDQLREDYMAAADHDMGRSWLHTMEMRQRIGIGHLLGHLAFTAWPRTPQLDREMMRTAAGIPMPLLAGRRLEKEILERFHTDLARLPLDRNDLDTTPPLPGFMDLVRAGVDRRIRRWRATLGVPRPERRYYHRTFDFNGSDWRVARQKAEADRERAYALFERDAYDSLVPPPEARWTPTGTIEGASSVKMLASLGVWMRVGLA